MDNMVRLTPAAVEVAHYRDDLERLSDDLFALGYTVVENRGHDPERSSALTVDLGREVGHDGVAAIVRAVVGRLTKPRDPASPPRIAVVYDELGNALARVPLDE